MGRGRHVPSHPQNLVRGSISVARCGPPRCSAEPRQGFHHHFPTTHTTPATKNGSRKKMTACRDVPWRVSYRALPTRFSKSCTRDWVQKNFGGTSNAQFVKPRMKPASASPPARTYTCVPMPISP